VIAEPITVPESTAKADVSGDSVPDTWTAREPRAAPKRQDPTDVLADRVLGSLLRLRSLSCSYLALCGFTVVYM
jgi:hypothetical protein